MGETILCTEVNVQGAGIVGKEGRKEVRQKTARHEWVKYNRMAPLQLTIRVNQCFRINCLIKEVNRSHRITNNLEATSTIFCMWGETLLLFSDAQSILHNESPSLFEC